LVSRLEGADGLARFVEIVSAQIDIEEEFGQLQRAAALKLFFGESQDFAALVGCPAKSGAEHAHALGGAAQLEAEARRLACQ
jgi:hypothetical protein